MQQGGPGGGGDMDRQLQDEMRRRQLAAQQEQQALQQQQQQQFMMDPNSPYYAQQRHAAAAHAAAYRHAAGYGGHLATPMSGTAGAAGTDGGAAASGAASNPQQLARLYAEQQHRQAQMSGGYPPAMHPYAHMDPRFAGPGAYSGGVPPTPNYGTREQQQHQEMVMQHHHQQAAAAAAAQQQHHAAAAAAAQQYREQQQDSAQKKAAAASTPSSSNGNGPKSPPPKASSIPANQLIPQSPVVTAAQAAAAAAGADSATKSSPSSNKKKDGGEEQDGTPSSTASAPSSPGQSSSKPSPSSAGPLLVRRSLGKDMPQHRQVDNLILDENDQRQWYTGCLPLGLSDDKYWLSELQVYLRANFAEAFGATEEDIAAPMHGRNKPIALGQVGIRCMHCKYDNPAERGQQATSYPSLISGIYNSVQQMLRLHLDCCLSMPPHVRAKIEQLKLSCSSRGGRKQYWIDSAKRLGLQDTPHGIHFARDPGGPLPPLAGPSVNSKEARRRKQPPPKASPDGASGDGEGAENGDGRESPAGVPDPAPQPIPKLERPTQPPVDSRPLVFPEDKPLISDYLYLTLEQMAPCNLMEADRVGCYKTRQVGFPGLACKHCVGQAGCGRYFPASEASLSQTTTSQTIMNHVRNCRRCPIEIRENLEIMKRNRMGPDGKRADKPKHGGRKVFFHRLWCRIQDIPFEEGKGERKESKKRTTFKKPGPQPSKAKKKAKKRDRRRSIEDSDDEASSETDTDTEDAESDGSDQDKKPRAKGSGKGTAGMAKRKAMSPWYEGCVRLTKTDDPHWLSEMECFARSDLVEVFSLKKKDSLDGYGGRKEPAIGQVGIRCMFCKNVDASERSNGCISFPDMLSSIHTKVADMTRLHFPNCPSMPEETKKTFNSLRRDDAKVANDDSQQYWVDAARDLGLANIPPDGIGASGSWGVTFRRDPLQPSPADELDLDTDETTTWGKNLMVKPTDRGLCTDHVLLMLCQVRPCRFRKSDRRAGPGSRGRDRAMGFPGLACMHCANRNSLGRYFPVSAKNLTDNTANSLQAHISSCSRCPEHIQASLAYLSHRSILQKAELSGSWKKAFFKKVWDRLHVDRSWTAIEDEGQQEGIEYDSADSQDDDEAQHAAEEGDEDEEEEEGDEEGKEGDEDGGEEKQEGQMDALIQAAAIWLTEQDEQGGTKSSGGRGKGRSGGGTKRAAAAASSSGSRGGRGTTSLPTKRARRGGGTT